MWKRLRAAGTLIGLVLTLGCAGQPVWLLHNNSSDDLIVFNASQTWRLDSRRTLELTLHGDRFEVLASNRRAVYAVPKLPADFISHPWLPWKTRAARLTFRTDGAIYLFTPDGALPATQPAGFPLEPMPGGAHLPPVRLTDNEDTPTTLPLTWTP